MGVGGWELGVGGCGWRMGRLILFRPDKSIARTRRGFSPIAGRVKWVEFPMSHQLINHFIYENTGLLLCWRRRRHDLERLHKH